MSVTWTYDSVKCLITLWQQEECLYKVNHPGYHNRLKRSRALHSIYQQMVSAGFRKWTAENINKKMRGLRTQYLAEKSKIKASRVAGAGEADVYRPKLWSYSLLDFLKTANTSAKGSTSTVNTLDETQQRSEACVDGYNSDNLSGVNMSSNWSQEYTRYLIELWAQHPVLSAASARDPSNKRHKVRALEELVSDLNAMGAVKFTVPDVRRKMHGLKTQYQKERSLIQQSVDSGATGDEVYVPKLWTYSLLHFICDTERAVSEYRSKTSNALSRASGPLVLDPLDISSLSSSDGVSKLLTNNHHHQVIENVLVKTQAPIVEVLPHQMELADDIAAYANVLVHEMRQLRSKARLRRFKRDVMNLIYTAQEQEEQEQEQSLQ